MVLKGPKFTMKRIMRLDQNKPSGITIYLLDWNLSLFFNPPTEFMRRVVQLSACGFHTSCLTADGELYSWGEGKFGRLGHANEKNCHVPRLVETLLGKRPRQVSCGGFHTAVVTEDGRQVPNSS